MVRSLFDTNILIDYLHWIEAARVEVNRFGTRAISVITWIGVMVGAARAHAAADRAVTLRQWYRLKLPDAIIWASVQSRSLLFVMRDSRDFPTDEPGIRIPYHL